MPEAHTPLIERIARVLAGLAMSKNANGNGASVSGDVDMCWPNYREDAVAEFETLRFGQAVRGSLPLQPSPLAGDVPMFWACGLTASVALEAARLPIAITHAPGCMVVTDLPG